MMNLTKKKSMFKAVCLMLAVMMMVIVVPVWAAEEVVEEVAVRGHFGFDMWLVGDTYEEIAPMNITCWLFGCNMEITGSFEMTDHGSPCLIHSVREWRCSRCSRAQWEIMSTRGNPGCFLCHGW